ncbi:MAG TPA: PKD domain-containing protein [Chitinivibrionales bacterium]|nr:PKD domain-containing protein [Chitinivibrionales bacterium]
MRPSIWKSALTVCGLAFLAHATLSQQDAMQIAQQEIQNTVKVSTCGRWTSQTQIATAYPIYIDGITGISYYECKATTNGVDAGYVLVNVNQTDVIIVESATIGKTLYEQFQAMLGSTNFIVCRYNDVCSAALDPTSKNVLATMGFPNPNQQGLAKTAAAAATSAITNFRAASQKAGCQPNYPPSFIKQYYSDSTKTVLGKIAAATTDFCQLKSSYSCSGYPPCNNTHPTLANIQTPPWNQYNKSDGAFNGCGPVAWAIVYGYWKQFKGKDKLFPGLANLNGDYCMENNTCSGSPTTIPALDQPVYNCMDICSGNMGTFEIGNSSATLPFNMGEGVWYAQNLGYEVTCTNNTAPTNLDEIKSNISNDQPVIIGTDDNFWSTAFGAPGGIPDHYIVAEQYLRCNKTVYILGQQIASYASSIKLYCNYGWGGNYKWLTCVQSAIGVPGAVNCYTTCAINNYYTVDFYATKVSGTIPFTVTFNLTNNLLSSVDPIWKGKLPCLKWDFGDGVIVTGQDTQTPPNVVTFTHKYAKAGKYTVALYASDAGCGTGWQITVNKPNYIHAYPGTAPYADLLLK